jgi:L,D-transpeptidase ErfK/SrfK
VQILTAISVPGFFLRKSRYRISNECQQADHLNSNYPKISRIVLALPLLLLGGCFSFDSFMSSDTSTEEKVVVPLEQRPVEEPIARNYFVLETPDQSVIGAPQIVLTRKEDTFSDLAREYGLGYDEIVAANPDVDPWLPGDNTPVLLPTQYVVPDVPREGLVLNIASKRLFYFPQVAEGQPQVVQTYPIGIGRVGWETPLGATTVIGKAKDPAWYVPASIRREHAEAGDPLPSVIPAGPDNPLGNRVLRLGIPGYLIHGTNQPYGVGMRVSHGCVRLYPENIELLYSLVDVGMPVRIINEPFLLGRLDGDIYFESHEPLEEDPVDPDARLAALFDSYSEKLDSPDSSVAPALGPDERDQVRAIVSISNGVVIRLADHDVYEVFARAALIRNTVEANPNEPTLAEVREMIDAELAQDASQENVLADEQSL